MDMYASDQAGHGREWLAEYNGASVMRHVPRTLGPGLLPVATMVLLAACDSPQSPMNCGAIPEQSVVVGETATVNACFEDANGDLLTYSASSSDLGVATVSIAGSMVTVTGVAPGTGLVTITATDVTDLTGQQAFRVMVPNRAPLAVGGIEARELQAGESGSVDVSSYFSEPDGQALSYAMSVSDDSVLAISAAGAEVTFEARAKGSATLTATATDPGGLSAVQSFVVTVPNRTPGAVGSIEPQTVEVDGAAGIDVSGFFTDPDGDDLVYTATSSDPAVAAVSISGGDLTVRAVAKGEAMVTVTATDTEGLTATQEFVVTVPNRAPLAVGSIDERTIEVDGTSSVELSGHFEDPDGDDLVHSAVTSNGAVAAVGVDGSALTVTAIAKGGATVTVTATDTEGLTATQAFQVTVPNRPPLATGSFEAQTIAVGEVAEISLSGHFSDPDGDNLAFDVAVSDEALIGAAVSDGALTVTAVAKGEATVTITATDTEGLTATQAFLVTVPNRPPLAIGTIEALALDLGDNTTVELAGYFEEPDGDGLVYSVSSSDATLIGVSAEGAAATVAALAKGGAVVTVTATDPEGLTATQTFEVSVANRPPHAVGSIEAQTVQVDESVAMELPGYFEDPDGDELVYTWATSEPSVLAVSLSGGTMTIKALRKGLAQVVVVATDPEDMTVGQEFFVAVPNRAPEAVGTVSQQRISQGGVRRLDPRPRFTDPDGDELVFRAESSNLTVARAWVATNGVVVRGVGGGTATVTLIAEDPEGLTAEQVFGVRVKGSSGSGSGSDTNEPPVATGQIRTQHLEEGDERMLDATSYFDDPDDDKLEFSARSSDLGVVEASVSGSEVELTVTGTGTATVEVKAQDAGGLHTTQAFGVTVAEASDENRAPALVGTIAAQTLESDGETTVDVSSYFTDPDNDPLEYSAWVYDVEVVTVTVSGSDIALQATGPGTATVFITAEDPGGLTAQADFGVTVLEPEGPNRPPVAHHMQPLRLKVGKSKTVDAAGRFEDPDGDELTLSAESSDTTVATATISGNELEVAALTKGKTTVTVTAEDPEGLSASGEFQVTVGLPKENQPPYVTRTYDSRNFIVGGERTIAKAKHFRDPDDVIQNLRISAESSDSTRMKVHIYPSGNVDITATGDGEATITITATDPGGLSASFSMVHTIGNNPPTLYDGPDRQPGKDEFTLGYPGGPCTTGNPHCGIPLFTSPGEVDTLTMGTIFEDNDVGDDDKLRFSASVSDPQVVRASIQGSGLYGWYLQVTGRSHGEATVTATATDLAGLEVDYEIPVTVSNNRPPTLTTKFRHSGVTEGDTLTYLLSDYFDDPDGDDLTYSATSTVPVNHEVSADTMWVTYNEEGMGILTVTATDPEGRYVNDIFSVLTFPADSTSLSQASLLIEAGESPSAVEHVAAAFTGLPSYQPLRVLRQFPRTRLQTALWPPGRPRAYSTRGQ